MFWGQLKDVESKKEVDCLYELCHGPISIKERHITIVARNRTGTSYSRHFHPECLWPYMQSARVKRLEMIKERRSTRSGPLAFDITDEQRKRRTTVVKYLSYYRNTLQNAYLRREPKMVATAKAGLVRFLTELQSGALGPPYWFKFGPELLELYEKGQDGRITADLVRQADSEDPMLAIKLLSAGDTGDIPELPEPVKDPKVVAQEAATRLEREQERIRDAAPKWWDDPEQKRLAQERAAVFSAEGDARVAAMLAAREKEETA